MMDAAEERQIASNYMGDFAWPTVLLAVVLTAAYVTVIVAGVTRTIPLWVGLLINSWLTFCFYTLHHEANHGTISGRHKNLKWLNDGIGMIAAIPLQLGFRPYSKMHLAHHAHTNVPDRDPDFFLYVDAERVIPHGLSAAVIKTLVCIPFMPTILTTLAPKTTSGAVEYFATRRPGVRRYSQICLLVLVLLAIAGWGVEALMLWWIPTLLGLLMLDAWFVWLPHRPFTETSRYRNTRIKAWFGSGVILLGQDYHLIHHLYPKVPFYRYRSLFREIRPSLEEHDAVIEGVDATQPV